jgi:hypothetical protein
VISPAFVRDYENKKEEYTCPKGTRIYCSWPSAPTPLQGNEKEKDKGKAEVKADQPVEQCQKFLGRQVSRSDGDGNSFTICSKCQRPSCRLCKGRFEHDPPRSSHRCIHNDANEKAFEGLKRGKDYQICPSEQCGIKIELKAACNAMRCDYRGTRFCYVCGEPAAERSDHWAREPDACPRYNQPGADNARFDPTRLRPLGLRHFGLRIVAPALGTRRNPMDLFNEPIATERGILIDNNHGHPLPNPARAISGSRHHPLQVVMAALYALVVHGERRNAIRDVGDIDPDRAMRDGEHQPPNTQLPHAVNNPYLPEPLSIALMNARRAIVQQDERIIVTIVLSVDHDPANEAVVFRVRRATIEAEPRVQQEDAH